VSKAKGLKPWELWRKRNQKNRQCLKCDIWFHSTGPGNRRCSRCAKDLAHVVVRRPLRLFLSSDAFFPRMPEGTELVREDD
jgi:uncharacterized paraquat-inducible protein A